MYLQRLNPTNPLHLEWAHEVMQTHPAFKVGSLYCREEARRLLEERPADCRSEDHLVFMLRNKERNLALANIFRHDGAEELATIDLLMVHAGQRRRGLGREFMEHLSHQARRWEGVRYWRLMIAASHADALPFWQAEGFHLTATDVVIDGHEVRAHLMQRSIRRGKAHDAFGDFQQSQAGQLVALAMQRQA